MLALRMAMTLSAIARIVVVKTEATRMSFLSLSTRTARMLVIGLNKKQLSKKCANCGHRWAVHSAPDYYVGCIDCRYEDKKPICRSFIDKD